MMIFSCNTPNKIDEISYPQLFIKSIKVEDILLRTSNTSTHLPQSELPVGLEYLSHSTDYLPDTIIMTSDTTCSFRFNRVKSINLSWTVSIVQHTIIV